MVQRGRSPKYENIGVNIIKSGQARGYREFDFSKKYYVSSSFVEDNRKLQKGDILINSTGVGTAGRVTLFELEGDYVVDSHITICRPNEKIIPSFMLFSLAHIGFENIEKMANGSSGQIEISINTIKNIQIPVPPLPEQQKIVEEVEGYEKEIAKAKAVMDGCAARKKAILENYLH